MKQLKPNRNEQLESNFHVGKIKQKPPSISDSHCLLVLAFPFRASKFTSTALGRSDNHRLHPTSTVVIATAGRVRGSKQGEKQETDFEQKTSTRTREGVEILAATCISTSPSQSRSLFLSPSLPAPNCKVAFVQIASALPQDSPSSTLAGIVGAEDSRRTSLVS